MTEAAGPPSPCFLFPSLTESLLHPHTYSLEHETQPKGTQESAETFGDKTQLEAVRNLMHGELIPYVLGGFKTLLNH